MKACISVSSNSLSNKRTISHRFDCRHSWIIFKNESTLWILVRFFLWIELWIVIKLVFVVYKRSNPNTQISAIQELSNINKYSAKIRKYKYGAITIRPFLSSLSLANIIQNSICYQPTLVLKICLVLLFPLIFVNLTFDAQLLHLPHKTILSLFSQLSITIQR